MEIDDWLEGMNLAYEYTEIEERAEGFFLTYPTRCNVTQFILSGKCSTCFGW